MMAEQDLVEMLGEVDLFRGLDSDQLAAISPCVRRRSFEKRQTIVALEEPGNDICLVLKGKVRVTLFSESGREVAFRDQPAGTSFGEIAAIDGGRRSANVIAMTECSIGSIGASDFMVMIRDNPIIAEAVLRKLTSLVRALSSRVFQFSEPVDVRICHELINMARSSLISENIARLVPAPKHADIANRVSTHREAVSRLMGKLKTNGVLQRGQGELIVTDLAALEAFARDLAGS
jgi:CRP-like cAMP-binding protein